MIRLRFVTCHDAVSAGIRFAEYGFWASHVDAVMPEGKYLGAHYDGGVQLRDPGYEGACLTREQFVPLPCAADVEQRFYEFLRAQIGRPYDIQAIAAFIARRDWRDDEAWFCSELQTAALEACGYLPVLPTNVSRIMPRDLLLIVAGRVPVEA